MSHTTRAPKESKQSKAKQPKVELVAPHDCPPALTIRQPWCSSITSGQVGWVFRSKPTDYRGPVVLHAGATPNALDEWQRYPAGSKESKLSVPDVTGLPRKAVVAVAELVDVQKQPGGGYNWVFSCIQNFSKPIPCNGERELFQILDPTVARYVALAVRHSDFCITDIDQAAAGTRILEIESREFGTVTAPANADCEIVTACYGMVRLFPRLNYVVTSVGVPAEFKDLPSMPELAPTYRMLKMKPDDYDAAYMAILDRLDPQEVYADLMDIQDRGKHPDQPVALLCHCAPGEFCHRRFAAEWLEQHLHDVRIPELGYTRDETPDHVDWE